MVEVLVALVVLALGLVGIAKFQGIVTKDGNEAKYRTEAAHIAQLKMEQLRNYATLAEYAAIATGEDAVGPAGATAGGVTVSTVMDNATTAYRRTWTVTDNTTYKTVSILVSWPDEDGGYSTDATANNTVKLDSYITRIDPGKTVLAGVGTTTGGSTTTTSTTTTTVTTAATPTTTAATTTTTATGPTSTTSTTTTMTTTTTTTPATTTTTVAATYYCMCRNGVPYGSGNPPQCGPSSPNYCSNHTASSVKCLKCTGPSCVVYGNSCP